MREDEGDEGGCFGGGGGWKRVETERQMRRKWETLQQTLIKHRLGAENWVGGGHSVSEI